ncbi:MAG: hypothetical protein KKC18_16960, partial [Chloroflexi bacterium]|nr:hypothetical protein [Chloroflexota bacterium]
MRDWEVAATISPLSPQQFDKSPDQHYTQNGANDTVVTGNLCVHRRLNVKLARRSAQVADEDQLVWLNCA